jgi:hypothetical protein
LGKGDSGDRRERQQQRNYSGYSVTSHADAHRYRFPIPQPGPARSEAIAYARAEYSESAGDFWTGPRIISGVGYHKQSRRASLRRQRYSHHDEPIA